MNNNNIPDSVLSDLTKVKKAQKMNEQQYTQSLMKIDRVVETDDNFLLVFELPKDIDDMNVHTLRDMSGLDNLREKDVATIIR